MGMQVIPTLMQGGPWEFYEGFVNAMLLALVLLAVLGVVRPVEMLPLLFWEILWKIIWLISVAAPMARDTGLDEDTISNIFACGLAAIFVIAMPWRYVWGHYIAPHKGVDR